MKNVTTLDLGERVFSIEFITSLGNAADSIVIELDDARPLSQIAEEFENCEKMVKTDSVKKGVTHVYEGFTELTSIQRNALTGTTRIVLKRP